ncbi:MAG: DUF4258 domain-containing protein [Desulfotomaculales bacterium]
MRRIRFTAHAEVKLELLKRHGFCVEQNFIENCINAPDKVEQGYGERKIAQKVFDESHVLRVVYEERGDEILVITVYPGRRSRYE